MHLRFLFTFAFTCIAELHSADVCAYCHCDQQTATATCTGRHVLLRSILLPTWVYHLHFSRLSLRHLPHFAYNAKLKTLRINRCGLTHIHPHSLNSLPALEILDLSDNLLTEFPKKCLYEIKNLKILNLAHNKFRNLHQITDILFPHHILDQLNLNANPIEVCFSGVRIPLTRQLFFADSNIHFINATSIIFTASEQCFVDVNCRILEMSEQHWTTLRTLDVSSQLQLSVHSSALKVFTNLTMLNLNQARLPDLFASWLMNSAQVSYLNLSHALILNMEENWRYCSEYLQWLDISYMNLKELYINGSCNLRYLKATDNALHKVVIATTSLQSLFLDRNNLTSWITLPPGIALSQLQTFSISSNKIAFLPDGSVTHYPQLQHLDLSKNLISNLSSRSFPSVGMQIRSLNISHNRLKSFVHPVLPSLILLDLSYNELTDLDPHLLKGLPMLQYFYLTHNRRIFSRCNSFCWLSSLDQLFNLIDLDLSSCRLDFVPNLSQFPALRRLDLSRNNIYLLDASLLPKNLISLDASNNHIHSIANFTTMRLKNLKDLNLAKNPLNCECKLSELIYLFSNDTYYKSDYYYCFYGTWKYSLQFYVKNMQLCTSSSKFLPTFLYFVLFLIGLIGAIIIILGASKTFLKRSINCLPVSFTYRPLTSNETAVADL